MTYYEQLNVPSDASAQQIKEAYRKLAFEYHPDRNTGDPLAADKMKAINEAYAVLSNPEKRHRYDALYRDYGDSASEHFRQSFSQQDIFRGSDIHQIFEEMARSFGLRGVDEIFKDFYGKGYHSFEFRQPGVFGKGVFFGGPLFSRGSDAKKGGLLGMLGHKMLNNIFRLYLPQRGRDLVDTIVIHPDLAKVGGPYAYFHRQRGKKLVVHVPAGVRHGQTIRLAGMGKTGSHGAESGDLFLRVQIKAPFIEKLKRLVGLNGPALKG